MISKAFLQLSPDASLAHSWNAWGQSHQSLISHGAKDPVYLVIILGALWVAINSFRTLKSFSILAYLKTLILDGLFILALPVGIATVISEVISRFYIRQRPFVSVEGVKLLSPHVADGGFPSHHAVFMIAIATAIYLRSRWAGLVLGALTVISGLARVSAGIHFPGDIIAGLIIGIVTVLIVNRLLLRFVAR